MFINFFDWLLKHKSTEIAFDQKEDVVLISFISLME